MKVLRQKEFVGLGDGFGGKKGRINKSRLLKKSDSFEKFGPWNIDLSENADEDLLELDDNKTKLIQKILKELETKPYQGNYGEQPLWEFQDKDNECVIWSAEIDDKNRITYLIFKQQNYILITNIGGHKVIDMDYAVRPKI